MNDVLTYYHSYLTDEDTESQRTGHVTQTQSHAAIRLWGSFYPQWQGPWPLPHPRVTEQQKLA